MNTYNWQTPVFYGPTTRPKLVARIPYTTQFFCEGNEVWNYNLDKPKGSRWEYYYSFLPQ